MYTIREQNVTEARQSFTSTLKEMASIEEKELIVVVRRHGELVGAIISSRELQRYSRWLSEQASDQEDSSDEDTQPLQEVTEDREPSSEQEETEALQATEASLNLPEGWSSPADYVRQCFAKGHKPEVVLKWLEQQYAPYGLTPEEAAQIVVGIAEEQGIEIG